MTQISQRFFHRDFPVRPSFRRGFTLVEILMVTVIVGLLLALTLPGFVSLSPSRKTGIHELAGFLESARARAIAGQTEMIVAFANGDVPMEFGPYRAYALFAGEDGRFVNRSGKEPLRRLSPWRSLPKGLVFAHREHFELDADTAFRTLHDAPARRSFFLPPSTASGTVLTSVALPFLRYGPDGGIQEPGFPDADALHLGIVEGYYDPDTERIQLTSKRSSIDGSSLFANGECLEVGYYTGRSRILTD